MRIPDGVDQVAPGEVVTYTIVVGNPGPSDAVGAQVADTFPAAFGATVTWTFAEGDREQNVVSDGWGSDVPRAQGTVVQSFERGEDWLWCFVDQVAMEPAR